MRNLVFAINITADGYCDHTLFNPSDDVLDYFTQLTLQTGTLLYGRKTYELMFPYWPEVAKSRSGQTDAQNEFAQAFVKVPQVIVFSKTLSGSEGSTTQIIRSNLQDEVQRLKREQGGKIFTGGIDLASKLLKLGLIDEIHLIVHPIIAGAGRRLFDKANFEEKLKLIESHAFKSGCVALHYCK